MHRLNVPTVGTAAAAVLTGASHNSNDRPASAGSEPAPMRRRRDRPSARGARRGKGTDLAIALVVIFAVWEFVARRYFVDSTSLAAPSAVLDQMWTDRDLYWRNTRSTCLIALGGFALGNTIAALGAAIFVLSPPVERVVSRLALALYALPTLVLAPVLGMFLNADATRVAVSALVVYFPTLVAVTAGLREPPRGTLELIHTWGGGRVVALRLVRIRWALPGLFAGMRVAVPGALLGAIASEWLGADRGLGIFMVNALGYLNTERVWGCCLVCVAITAFGYAVVGVINRRVNNWQNETSS